MKIGIEADKIKVECNEGSYGFLRLSLIEGLGW